ncbi:MAG: hypothetical protein Q9227_007510 [Pyrenula ochraceoflavens]
MADYEENNDDRAYARDRSASPRESRGDRNRSRSPAARDARGPPVDTRMKDIQDEEEGAANTGSNLFVTGIHPRLSEGDVTRLFEKYGEVESCSIMKDPHTQESRGFGFVNMGTSSQADAAKEGLQGEVIEGRTFSIEKARRSRPRTPTPGKYFGPPKRGDFRGRGGRFDRYDDRRGGYGGRRYDDGGYRGGSRYDSYERRDYGGRRDYRDDYGSRGIDRYAGRDERYGGRGEDRRGGGSGGYYGRYDDRSYGGRDDNRDSYAGGRDYESRDDRYGGR